MRCSYWELCGSISCNIECHYHMKYCYLFLFWFKLLVYLYHTALSFATDACMGWDYHIIVNIRRSSFVGNAIAFADKLPSSGLCAAWLRALLSHLRHTEPIRML